MDKRSVYWFVGTLIVSACMHIYYRTKADRHQYSLIKANPSKDKFEDDEFREYERNGFRWAIVFAYALITVVVITF